ncbi:MAG: tRNA uridine-5-carboxymethylaminomethyl(34) synthesis GTPase MnmE [Opitutaceae bacterium]|jgi:tRNA modification GTPase|nr:tRNA uridine-5-carboxymethylaminomethyl(34) synthesis GTPase MnmE [Opitutaceae bacterium]
MGTTDPRTNAIIHTTDTIAALATPAGTAAIALIRVSGPGCAALATSLLGRLPSPRLSTRADYRELSGRVLDDILVTRFSAPRSYTGEDTLELSCHGNPLLVRLILDDLLRRGCRLAEPGEFTRRAFLNGRLDLTEAEAVMDLIHARSERALAAANRQLRGSLGRHLATLTEALLLALARIEAYIDFPDEDLPVEDRALVATEIETVLRGTNRLLATHRYGEILREGIKTVIIGEPNAGKSSLLNRLVGSDRALVSPEPGTTRDFIEERILVGPHCLRLIDTAGLNPSPATLEKLGIEKTLERTAEADLFLWVQDATLPSPALPPALPPEIAARLTPRNTLVLRNKSDLLSPPLPPPCGGGFRTLALSALTCAGLDDLTAAIADLADSLANDTGDELIAVNARHADALRRALDCLDEARHKLATGAPTDELLASDLRGALDALGEISGKIDNERMLDHLFATFCIGK